MQYLLTILGNEAGQAQASKEEQGKTYAAYGQYTAELKKAGVFAAGDGLMPTSAGARIQVRAGKRSVVDGPFTEAKEVLGGYYLLNCNTKEEAVEWAVKCPGAVHGTIEIRQVMAM